MTSSFCDDNYSKIKINTDKKLFVLAPISARRAGSRIRKPSQILDDLEDSPHLKVDMDQHPNPYNSRDITSMDTVSDVNAGSHKRLTSKDVKTPKNQNIDEVNQEYGLKVNSFPFP